MRPRGIHSKCDPKSTMLRTLSVAHYRSAGARPAGTKSETTDASSGALAGQQVLVSFVYISQNITSWRLGEAWLRSMVLVVPKTDDWW